MRALVHWPSPCERVARCKCKHLSLQPLCSVSPRLPGFQPEHRVRDCFGYVCADFVFWRCEPALPRSGVSSQLCLLLIFFFFLFCTMLFHIVLCGGAHTTAEWHGVEMKQYLNALLRELPGWAFRIFVTELLRVIV